MDNSIKKNIADYAASVRNLVYAFIEKQYDTDEDRDSTHEDSYWIAEDVGGTFVVGGAFLDFHSDILYDLRHDIPAGEIFEWNEYYSTCASYGLPAMNYQSWCSGAPRYSKEDFEALRIAAEKKFLAETEFKEVQKRIQLGIKTNITDTF